MVVSVLLITAVFYITVENVNIDYLEDLLPNCVFRKEQLSTLFIIYFECF